MADEPERSDESQLDESHQLDMVVLFSSPAHDAEMETLAIHGLLEANGLHSTVVGPSTIPSLEFQVQVPRDELQEARRVLEEARAAGPEGAEEAEKSTEGLP